MKNNFFSQTGHYTVCFFKYLLYLFNLAVLTGLGIKTVNLWISTPFDFSDTLAAFPEEPEFTDKISAEKQFWTALTIETLIFVIGGFLCYEVLIKQKTFRRGITAPLVVAFLWAAGESIFLFLPATEKAQTINVCRAADISWDTKKHKCRLMDLELKRFEKLKALKTIRSAAKTTKKAAVTKPKPKPIPKSVSAVKTATTQKTAASPNVPEKTKPVAKPKKAAQKQTVKTKQQGQSADKNKTAVSGAAAPKKL